MDVNVLFDISSVLANHWRLILGILLILLLSQSLVWSALKMIFGSKLTYEEYYSLSLSGWMLPLSLASVLWFAWGKFQLPASGAFVGLTFLVILACGVFLSAQTEPVSGSKSIFLILLALFGISVLLRSAFVAKAVIPLYFDSAQHYLTIKNLLREFASSEAASFRWPTPNYYHIGFHLLSALVASTLRADVNDVILIVGQIVVVTIPFSVFFLVKHETQSNAAGIFAMLLAGFGWYMPAYTVNWGKYPALTSLPLIGFVLSLAYLALRYKANLSSKAYAVLLTLLLLGIVITGFVHSRSLVIFGLLFFVWVITAGWRRLPKLPRVVLVCAVLLGITLEIIFIRTKDVLGPLFDPYWNRGLLVTAIVLFLSIFAQKVYPRLAFALILAIVFLLGAMFIPVTVPGYGELTLLDRPFVEMILYLPLSFLGGIGLAGLEQTLQPFTDRWQAVRLGMGSLFIGLIVVNAFLNYTLYPSDCCSIVSRDDLVAIDWMDKNLPSEARILTSSTELRVLASDSFQASVSGDAGAWITPLTDRATIPLPYYSDFGQQTTFDTLCQLEANYIYVGESGTTFNNEQIEPYPNWYKVLLSMPNVKIYQVTGCE